MRSEPSQPAEEMRELIDQLHMLQSSLSESILELEEADDFLLLPRMPATAEAAPIAVARNMRPEQRSISADLAEGVTAALEDKVIALPMRHTEITSENDESGLNSIHLPTASKEAAIGAFEAIAAQEPVHQEMQQRFGFANSESASLIREDAARGRKSPAIKSLKADEPDIDLDHFKGLSRQVEGQRPQDGLYRVAQRAAESVPRNDNVGVQGSSDDWIEALFPDADSSRLQEPEGEGTDRMLADLLADQRPASHEIGIGDSPKEADEKLQTWKSDLRETFASSPQHYPRTAELEHGSSGLPKSKLIETSTPQQATELSRLEVNQRVVTLQSQLSNTEAVLSELQASLAKSDSSVKDLSEDVARKSQELTDLQNTAAASEAKAALEIDALQLELEASQETVSSMQADLEAERQLAYNTSAAHSLALELAQQHLYGTVSQLSMKDKQQTPKSS